MVDGAEFKSDQRSVLAVFYSKLLIFIYLIITLLGVRIQCKQIKPAIFNFLINTFANESWKIIKFNPVMNYFWQ